MTGEPTKQMAFLLLEPEDLRWRFLISGRMWKFPGQGLNACHSSDNTGFLTCCTTRELLNQLLQARAGSSHCSAAGWEAASWERWDAGLTPGLAQWVKDLALLNHGLGHDFGWDLIPGPGTPHAAQWPKNKQTKKSQRGSSCCSSTG